jgi:hypothetical protein
MSLSHLRSMRTSDDVAQHRCSRMHDVACGGEQDEPSCLARPAELRYDVSTRLHCELSAVSPREL